MIKTLKFLLCFGVILLFTGCSDTSDMERSIKLNNEKVAFALDSYEKSKEKGKQLETIVFEVLRTGDVSPLSQEIDFLNPIRTYLFREVDNLLPLLDSLEEDEFINKSREDLLSEMSEVHYFLDSETGVVEQMFLFRPPSSSPLRFSIYWLGGMSIAYEEISRS